MLRFRVQPSARPPPSAACPWSWRGPRRHLLLITPVVDVAFVKQVGSRQRENGCRFQVKLRGTGCAAGWRDVGSSSPCGVRPPRPLPGHFPVCTMEAAGHPSPGRGDQGPGGVTPSPTALGPGRPSPLRPSCQAGSGGRSGKGRVSALWRHRQVMGQEGEGQDCWTHGHREGTRFPQCPAEALRAWAGVPGDSQLPVAMSLALSTGGEGAALPHRPGFWGWGRGVLDMEEHEIKSRYLCM